MFALTRRLCLCTVRNYSAMACSKSIVTDLLPEATPIVNVKRLPGDEHMDLCFVYQQKQVKMHRSSEEPLGKTLKRMLISVSKPDKQARKKRGVGSNAPPSSVPAHLYEERVSDSSFLSPDTLNRDAWVDGALLVVGDSTYRVHLNVSAVLSLRVPLFALVGGAIVPEVELEFTDSAACQWTWQLLPESCDSLPSSEDLLQYPVVSTTMTYWPSPEDVGHKLVVQCTPSSPGRPSGSPLTAISPVVMDTPPDTPITRRQLYTPSRLESRSQFRVVTYNTLAEPFSNTDYAKNVLYPYCDPTALHINYRQSLIVRELVGYNADVLCLQEVGTKMYQRYLQPALEDKGYEGTFVQKGGMMPEGEAIFFDASKFSLVARESSPLSTFLQTHPSCEQLARGLSTAPLFLSQVLKKHNIVMSLLLKSRDLPNHYLLVATTHLYYHPRGDHIRLAQVAILIKFLESKLEVYRQQLGRHAAVATMICGDFNSCPCIAAYNYVLSGSVATSYPDWTVYKLAELRKCKCDTKQRRTQTEDGYDCSDVEIESSSISTTGQVHPPPNTAASNETVSAPNPASVVADQFQGLHLEHSFHFSNVCGTEQFTNYTLGFKGVLDYVFADSDNLSIVRTVPLPTLPELSEFVALPSIYFPSDHVALVADLEWND